MISITMQNKESITVKILKGIAAAAFWIIIWEAASLIIDDNLKMFLPSPFNVIRQFFKLMFKGEFILAALKTLLRIALGFLSGIAAGILTGILTNLSKTAHMLISPILRIIRAVPVVSFIILAFLFIRVDTLPVFISFLMVLPVIWQSTDDSLRYADESLCEMGKAFGLSKAKILFRIRLPLSLSQIITSCINGLGLAWKSGVAAEVICTPEVSLGHEIFRGKFNLDYEYVYAVTLAVVVLSIFIEIILKFAVKKLLRGGGK